MKHTIILSFLFCSFYCNAQFRICNVFLQGNYVQVGIAPNGAFGSTCDVPTGYISNVTQTFYNNCDTFNVHTSRNSLGFIADPDKDGWSTGTPAYYGDYFLPGSPQEGWAIGMNDSEANAYDMTFQNNGSGFSKTALSGQNILYTNTGSSVSGLWAGTYTLSSSAKLSISQSITIDANSLYAVAHIVLKNIGTGTVRKIYYMRTFDGDDDQKQSGDYATRNVCTQLPNTNNIVAVSTNGLHYSKAFCELGTINCHAKAFILTGGLAPTATMASMYAGTASAIRYDSSNNDNGVGIVFSLDTLLSGDSLSFSYAYIFKGTDADSFFAAPKTTWSTSLDANTHKSKDTVYFCPSSGGIGIAVTNVSYDQWSWGSPTGNTVTPATGSTVTVIPSGSSTIIVDVIGTSSQCNVRPDTTIMVFVPQTSITPSITIHGPLLKATGKIVSLTATIAGAGSTYNIFWWKNGLFMGTSTTPSFTYTKTAGNDTIHATIYSTGTSCYDTAVSNTIIVYDPQVGVPPINVNNSIITVYPNPVKNEITITGLSVHDKLIIYDQLGRQVFELNAAKDGDNIFNMAKLQAGFYVIHVLDDEGTSKTKLSMQKL